MRKIFAENKALSRPVNTEIAASINVEQTETESQNVVALLPGNDPQLKNEYVVAGAHYDHLGIGEFAFDVNFLYICGILRLSRGLMLIKSVTLQPESRLQR